jgi:hypothetical protein
VLSLAHVYALIGYYLENQAKVDEYLAQRKTQRAQLRQEVEARHQPEGIRERLTAMRRTP